MTSYDVDDLRMLLLVHPDDVDMLTTYANSDPEKVELRLESWVPMGSIISINRSMLAGRPAPLIWPAGLPWPPP